MKNFVRIEKSLEAQINFNQNFETEKPERCLVVGIFTIDFFLFIDPWCHQSGGFDQ